MENLQSYEEMLNESKSAAKDKGIHPMIKPKLVEFIKNNPNAKFKDAARHIAKAIKGWKLSEIDFEKCKKECDSKKDEGESKKD